MVEEKQEGAYFEPSSKIGLTQFDMGLFSNHQPLVGHEDPHHNFVVIVPMIMKFGTDFKIDVFYTMVTKTL